ncbi:MmcQ/YjbR family DNA-binding protein [Aestuariimicrobium ganziense]|uniref:MmcQ/YjbR family DNA-binding protein n=1 Tax=Aestuariimicrobium ganziense TaxID=2773677 RepID=UPI0019405364|nr:MmcQ/YjbR family DNA-binding protein [Aestuariimicrobium ganziense]
MAQRIPLTPDLIARVAAIMAPLPETYEEDAWVGVRWRVGHATIVHLFGGEDQQYRIIFRGEPDEVLAFEHMGDPYFRTGWGTNVIGMIIDDDTDWDDVAELLASSYLIQAPKRLAARVVIPQGQPRR